MTRAERWLACAARERGTHPALVVGDESVPYAELEARVAALARRLAAAGLREQDRLALWLANGPLCVELIHAAQALGAVLVPLNQRLTAHELAPLVDAARPRLLVCDRERRSAAEQAAKTAAETRVVDAVALARLEPASIAPAPDFALERDHAILFTSGTAGRPKGVRLSCANQLASATGSARRLGNRPGDRWLLCMPAYHIGGLAIVLRCAIDQTTLVLHETFEPHAVAESFWRGEVTLASLVPTMLGRVVDALGERRAAPALRAVLIGGGPIDPALLRRARHSGVPVAPTYGLTEAASQVATRSPDDSSAGEETVGMALDTTELCVADERRRPLPAGRSGEILVRGPQVMRGYLEDELATAAVVRDGWLHTGDIGTLDASGRLTVLERRADLIVSGGENVYPAEVEAVLLACEGVREAAVVGVRDREWGHRVEAHVVADVRLRREDLLAFCRERLAGFKLPRAVHFQPALPRTASGKLRRSELRALGTSGDPHSGD